MQLIIQLSNVEYFFTQLPFCFYKIFFHQILFNPQYHKHSSGTLSRMERYKYGYVNEKKRDRNSSISSSGAKSNQNQQPSKSPQKPSIAPKLTASVIKLPPDTTPQQLKQNTLQQTGPLSSTKQTTTQKIIESTPSPGQKNMHASKSQTQKDLKNLQAKNIITERSDFLKQQTQPNKALSQTLKPPLLQSQSQATLRTQFLMIPDAREVLKQQKIKQQRMMEQERQKQLEAKIQRQTQSEIVVESKPHNSFYENWKQQQQIQSKSVIIQKSDNKDEQQSQVIKPANSFYEEWKRKQEQAKEKQQIIQEQQDEESAQFSPNSLSFNKTFENKNIRDLQSNFSAKSNHSDELNLEVPIFTTKIFPQIRRRKSSSCVEASFDSPIKQFQLEI